MKETVKNALRKVHLQGFLKYCFSQLVLLKRNVSGIDNRIIERYLNSNNVRKLQIGCGEHLLSGWLNSDFEPSSSDVMYLDSTKSFPIGDCMFDYVYSEHNIEHIAYPEGVKMLSECYRILKNGGKIRIATPDVLFLLDLFKMNKSELQNEYINWLIDAYIPEATSYDETFIINTFIGSFGHKFIYNTRLLRSALEEAGFINIVQCNLLESEEKELRNLENTARQSYSFLALETMVFEGTKPNDGMNDNRAD